MLIETDADGVRPHSQIKVVEAFLVKDMSAFRFKNFLVSRKTTKSDILVCVSCLLLKYSRRVSNNKTGQALECRGKINGRYFVQLK